MVYHGTKTAGFTKFIYDKNSQTGTNYGEVYYFTLDMTKVKGYSYDINKDVRIAEYERGK